MIVVSLKRLIISLSLILSSTLFLLVVSLDLISPLSLGESLEKQDLLFWGIIVFLFQSIMGISILTGHRNVISDLNRLISNKDLSHPHSRKILNQLGPLGQVISRMMKELNELLSLRTDRISALNKVVRLLCDESGKSLVVSDTMGTVLGVSESLLEKTKLKLSDLSTVTEVLPGIKIAEVMVALEKNRDDWKDSGDSGVVCTPVFDKSGHLNLCIWVLESAGFIQKINRHPANMAARKKMVTFRDLMKRKKKE